MPLESSVGVPRCCCVARDAPHGHGARQGADDGRDRHGQRGGKGCARAPWQGPPQVGIHW